MNKSLVVLALGILLVMPIAYADNGVDLNVREIGQIEWYLRDMLGNPLSISYDKPYYQLGDEISIGVTLPVYNSECDTSVNRVKIWLDGSIIADSQTYFASCSAIAVAANINLDSDSLNIGSGEHTLEIQFFSGNTAITPKETSVFLMYAEDDSDPDPECTPMCFEWSDCMLSPTHGSDGYQTRSCVTSDCSPYMDERGCDYPHTHMDCREADCTQVSGYGNDECNEDSDCVHMACTGEVCTQVIGDANDECLHDSDCIDNNGGGDDDDNDDEFPWIEMAIVGAIIFSLLGGYMVMRK